MPSFLDKIGSALGWNKLPPPVYMPPDPAIDLDLPGDEFAIPKVAQFAGTIGTAARTYLHDRWDEALKKSREYALDMRRDPSLMAPYDERRREVIKQKWHLEVDDEKDVVQKAVKEKMTSIIRGIPHFNRLVWSLLDAIWYGKYGSQVIWEWKDIADVHALTIKKHHAVNGDKFGHHWDGTPYCLVNAAKVDWLHGAKIITSTQGMAVSLVGTWRERFIIHTHEVDDADYYDAEGVEGIHGVGLRTRLFWLWWLKQELLSNVWDFMERVGLGVTLWYYDGSNPASEEAVKKASKEQSRRDNIYVPLWPEKSGGMRGGLERIETPVSGAEALLSMKEHFDKLAERYIVGQSASSRSETSGLGTHDTDMQADTKRTIAVLDCTNVAETITGSESEPGVISVIKRWTFPEAKFPVRFKYDICEVDPAKVLDACKTFVDMGGECLEDEVRGLIPGLSKPNEGDKTLGGKEALADAQMAGMPGEGAPQPGQNGQAKKPGANGQNGHALGKEPGGRVAQYQAVEAASHYAAGQWVTLGSREGEDGKKHGGSPVFIEGGRITKGAPSLTGHRIGGFKEPAESTGTHRQQINQGREYNRAVWGKKARQAGLDPKSVHQLAAEMVAHHDAFAKGKAKMLKDARRLSKALGHQDLTSLKAINARGKIDASLVKGLDDTAARMKEAYPDYFPDDDAEQRLFDMLTEQTEEGMTEDEAYEQAFEIIQEGKEAAEIEASEEPVPF